MRCNAFGYFGRVVVWVGVFMSMRQINVALNVFVRSMAISEAVYGYGGGKRGGMEEETPSPGAII